MIQHVLIVAAMTEAVTIISRIIFGPVDRYTRKLTGGWHVHHGYVGLVFLAVGLIFNWYWVIVIGLGLFISDIFHHFVTLPLWVKRTELW